VRGPPARIGQAAEKVISTGGQGTRPDSAVTGVIGETKKEGTVID